MKFHSQSFHSPPGRARQRLALRDAARAAYCQMYYWGRDVVHPHGNLLVRHGFEKIQRTSKEGTSRYRMEWEGGILELHGFCAGWYAAEGPGICFDRSHDTWRQWNHPLPPEPARMQAGHYRTENQSENLPLLLDRSAHFVHWLVQYERWAMEREGTSFRREQHRDFMKLPARRWWLPPGLAINWMSAYAADPNSVPRPKSILGKKGQAISSPPPRFL